MCVKKGPRDALISRLRIKAHPHLHPNVSTLASISPSRTEMQTSTTINLTLSQSRVYIAPSLPGFLEERQYNLWTLLDKQVLKPSPHSMPGQLPQEKVFDLFLHPGVNVIEVHVVAAIPKAQRVVGASDVEIESFTVFANVLRN